MFLSEEDIYFWNTNCLLEEYRSFKPQVEYVYVICFFYSFSLFLQVKEYSVVHRKLKKKPGLLHTEKKAKCETVITKHLLCIKEKTFSVGLLTLENYVQFVIGSMQMETVFRYRTL